MKPKYSPTHYSKRVTDVILSVYDNADFSDKQIINKLTNPLLTRCRNISREGAVEILGKVGMWLARNEKCR